MSEAEDIKKAIQAKKITIGKETTIKILKKGEAGKVIMTSNCSDKDEIRTLCKIGNIELVETSMTNEELSTLCKKPFNISIVGIKK